MPSIRQSQIDPSKLGAAVSTAQPTPVTSSPVMTGISQSPFMMSPMPIAASGSDSLARQFYSNSNLPQTRLLPARSQR